MVLKPAEQTPASILVLVDLIGDLLPPGVLNVVNGFGLEAGKPLASSNRIAKIAFTGETTTGRLIMQYASQSLIPVTLELGGKSPNIFFEDVTAKDDDFFDKAIEGFVLFALNQGEVCTCPSRALIHESIYDRFMERALKRVEAIVQDDPFDPATMIGAQASGEQFEKILAYIDIGRQEGAEVLAGGERATMTGDLAGGYYVKPTVFKGHNKMRIFQEEIFGPVVAVTTFKDDDEALAIANDTLYGLGAGVWTRDITRAYRFGRGIQAGPGLDQLLPRLPGACGLRRLQAVGHRPREPQDDARPLPADQEHAGQLQPEEARLLLTKIKGGAAPPPYLLPHAKTRQEEAMAKTMKAAVVREFGKPLTIDEVPVPEPGPGEIQVKIQASGVCHTDLHAAEGDWPVKPNPPFIPGHEGVGFVSAVGQGVRHVKEGDRVGVPWLYTACGHCKHCLGGWETLCVEQKNTGYSVNGGFADYVVADPNYVGHLPANIDFVEMAPVLCAGVTVYKGLKVTDTKPGDWVVISGVGGLGHMAVQYAKAMGMNVAAVDIADDKLELAKKLGATLTVNALEEDPAAVIKRETGGGAQGVLVTAVSRKAFEQAIGMVGRGGTVSLNGLPPGDFPLDIFGMVLNGITVRGSIVGTRLDLQELHRLRRAGQGEGDGLHREDRGDQRRLRPDAQGPDRGAHRPRHRRELRRWPSRSAAR